MAYLEIKNLYKRFGRSEKYVVNDLNLSIEKGEFVVFLGPSGCGKTTTIRMIAGLEDMTSGTVQVDGVDISNLPVKDRGVSMIFQSYAVWPHMTVHDNIAYPLKLRKMEKPERERRIREAAGKTGILEYMNRYPAQLSGGQRQRVAVARAMVVDPKIFLMDEPLSNLDAMLRVTMRTELKNIHNQLHATTIFVTHDQTEAMSLADRIVLIKDGVVEQVGTPYQMYHDCETKFAAAFIGTPPTNFFDVVIEKNGNGYLAKNRHICCRIDECTVSAICGYVGKTADLGIRPENIEISREQTDCSFACVTAGFIEPQGPHNVVIINIGENAVKVQDKTCTIAAGSTIWLCVQQKSIMLFDCETGKRIR